MRVLAVIVVLLGLASLALGILFIFQAADAEQEVADSIAPLPLDQLDATYDSVTAQYQQMKAAGAPIDANYNALYGNKVGLGLARANVGTASFVQSVGIISSILGAGVVLTGIAILRKASS